MPKLLFAVDHTFRRSQGAIYTMGGKFPYSGWESYLGVFSRIKVLSRGRVIDDPSGLSESSGLNVEFVLTDGARGLRRIFDKRQSDATVLKEVSEADVVVARIPSELGLTACRGARQQNKPYLIELVACPWDALWFHGSLAAKLYAPVLWWRTRQAVRRAPVVRYVTKEFLQRRYPTRGKAFVASNVQLPPLGTEEPIPARPRPLSDGILVFGTIGALHTRLKGVQTAIAALAAIKKSYPDSKFEYRVLGEGDPCQFIEQAAALGVSSNVVFHGTLPAGAAVRAWLDQIDVYLQPSFQEGLPRALIEAMSRGCVCIGSTAGGTPELLPDNRTHRPGDVARLTDAIHEVLHMSPEEYSREGHKNASQVEAYRPEEIYKNRLGSLLELKRLNQSSGS